MVVDDSRAIRAVLKRIMGELGFAVSEAGDGQEALERLRRDGMTDLVLVDWNMPTMNGLEFIRAVRAEPGNESLRLMMVTTETEMAQVALALEAGADEYVMKPFDKEIIREKLELLGIHV
jgi:two-component system chemotaxis response regulator CheY